MSAHFALQSKSFQLFSQSYMDGRWRYGRWSVSSISTSKSTSSELMELRLGDSSPCSPCSSSDVSPSRGSWSVRSWSRKRMYLRARRRISFLLSFLSGGCVGMRRRSSAKAPFTFCCRQRSLLLVKIRRTILGPEPGGQESEEKGVNKRSGLGGTCRLSRWRERRGQLKKIIGVKPATQITGDLTQPSHRVYGIDSSPSYL